jgi:hypothetical protein
MTTSMYLILLLFSTIIVEWIFYFVFIRKNPFNLFLTSILINALTLPLATYTYYFVYTNFFIIELIVIVSESLLLFVLLRINYPRALFLSFGANIITSLLGFLL